MSSPVKLAGAGNHSTRPRSSIAPAAVRCRARPRGGQGAAPPHNASSTSRVPGPDTRITAMAARPGAARQRNDGVVWGDDLAAPLRYPRPQPKEGPCRSAIDGNRLGSETSPYLLQHKDNPVHWRAWGEAALAEAKRDRQADPALGRLRRLPLVPRHGA